MTETISPDKKRTLTLNPVRGTPPVLARIHGEPTWTVDAPNIVSLFPIDGGKKLDVVNIGPGTATITVTADADLGEGVRLLTQSIQIVCVEGEAERLEIAVGPESDL